MTTERTPVEARAGITPGIVRYVLIVSSIGAIAALAATWALIA